MDKQLLAQGVRKMAITLVLMFTGPTFVYQAFKNEGHPWYYFVLSIGLLMCLFAIIQGFLGIKKIVDAILGKKQGT
jgi:hypothetical protein